MWCLRGEEGLEKVQEFNLGCGCARARCSDTVAPPPRVPGDSVVVGGPLGVEVVVPGVVAEARSGAKVGRGWCREMSEQTARASRVLWRLVRFGPLRGGAYRPGRTNFWSQPRPSWRARRCHRRQLTPEKVRANRARQSRPRVAGAVRTASRRCTSPGANELLVAAPFLLARAPVPSKRQLTPEKVRANRARQSHPLAAGAVRNALRRRISPGASELLVAPPPLFARTTVHLRLAVDRLLPNRDR